MYPGLPPRTATDFSFCTTCSTSDHPVQLGTHLSKFAVWNLEMLLAVGSRKLSCQPENLTWLRLICCMAYDQLPCSSTWNLEADLTLGSSPICNQDMN
jgi:hypothetical protein